MSVLEFHKVPFLVLFCSTSMWTISPTILTLRYSSHQYADDTSLYSHCKPADINSCENNIQSNLDDLSTWSTSNSLVLNPKKTKVMLFSTTQLSRVHHLEEHSNSIHLHANGVELKQTNNTLLLVTVMQQNLKWNDDVKLRKLKYLAPYNIRKQLAESLVLLKLVITMLCVIQFLITY